MIFTAPRLIYLFLETVDLTGARTFFEEALRLPLIEVEPHLPHHKHGVVKYDAGGLVLSLNLTEWARLDRRASDALVTVMAMDPTARDRALGGRYTVVRRDAEGIHTDPHGHHVAFVDGPDAVPDVRELRLATPDLHRSVAFYRDLLALEIRDRSDGAVRFAAGRVDVVLERAEVAVDGRPGRQNGYLLVFFTPDIVSLQRELMARGVPFRRSTPGFSEIGGSSRFQDPAGHTLCLYEPSAECLTWGSGATIVELINAEGGSNARRVPDRLPVLVRE